MTLAFRKLTWALLVSAIGFGGPLLAQTTDADTATTEPAQTPPPLPAPEPSSPPPLPPQPDFFIDQNGTPGGPFTMDELQAFVAAGSLTPDTLAWTAGMADWAAAGGVAGLEPLFAVGLAPAVTPDAPAVPAPDLAAAVVGNWMQTGPVEIPGVGPGVANIAASFGADGNFQMSGTIEAINAQTGSMTIQIAAQGSYTIQPQGVDQFSLTQTGNVTMTMPGFAPVEQAISESTVYRLLDANTIEDTTTGDRLIRQP